MWLTAEALAVRAFGAEVESEVRRGDHEHTPVAVRRSIICSATKDRTPVNLRRLSALRVIVGSTAMHLEAAGGNPGRHERLGRTARDD